MTDEREKELRCLVEKGDWVALEAPAVSGQMGVILEQSICSLQACLFLCFLCIFLALSLSLYSFMGRNFCLCSI